MIASSDNRSFPVQAALAAILLLGLILRVREFLFDRSFWLDEALLANNIVSRSFAGLLQPLDHNQGAPPGFLLLQKGMITLFGNSDAVLRTVPLLAGVGALALVWRVAMTCAEGMGRIALVAAFAVNPWLIYYSAECKQYSTDVLVCLALFLGAVRCLGDEPRPRDYFLLAAGGCVALWFSHPALFVLAGIVLAMIPDILSPRAPRERKILLAVPAAWLLNFFLAYVAVFRRLAANEVLLAYWKDYFLPLPPWSNPGWFPWVFTRILAKPLGLPLGPLVGALLLAGAAACAVRKRKTFILLAAPPLLSLIASGLRRYPFGDRLLLFAVPFFLLFLAEGVAALERGMGKLHAVAARSAGVMVIALLVAAPAGEALDNFREPPQRRGHQDRPEIPRCAPLSRRRHLRLQRRPAGLYLLPPAVRT